MIRARSNAVFIVRSRRSPPLPSDPAMTQYSDIHGFHPGY